MNVSDVLRRAGRTKRMKKRKGRGPASGSGKTCGRGTKGVRSRSGGSLPPWYEGGATPTYRRFPKRGFSNAPFQTLSEEVNVGSLKRFEAGSEVGPEEFKAAGFIKGKGPVKVLGKGGIDRVLTVSAHKFSAAAKEKIEAAGGKVVEIS